MERLQAVSMSVSLSVIGLVSHSAVVPTGARRMPQHVALALSHLVSQSVCEVSQWWCL